MLVNPWTPALLQPQLLVEIVRGLAGQRGGPAWQKQCWSWGCRSWSFTAHPPALHATSDGAQARLLWAGNLGRWVVGQLGGGPWPSLPLAAPTPGMRTRRGSPGSGGIGAPLVRCRSKVAGCLPLSPVHGPSTCRRSLDAGGPEGLVWTQRSTQYLRPRRAPGLGAAAPPSLYFTHSPRSAIPWESPSPFRPSRVGGRQDREGDQPGIE